MVFGKADLKFVAIALSAALLGSAPAEAQEFPFGLEMTLEVARMPGSKRIPSLEIGDNGEVVLELWCKGGKGQFSVAGNTVIFVAGAGLTVLATVLADVLLGQLSAARRRRRLAAAEVSAEPAGTPTEVTRPTERSAAAEVSAEPAETPTVVPQPMNAAPAEAALEPK